jgi:pikromycin synthase
MTTSLPEIDVLAGGFWRDPAATARPLLESGARTAAVPAFGGVMLLRYQDCQDALMAHGDLGNVGSAYFETIGWTEGPYLDWCRVNIVMVNPPAHTRLRQLVHRAFTPRHVDAIRPLIRQTANELCDEVGGAGTVEFMGTWARLLPLRVICGLLGLPSADHDQLGRWSEALNASSGIPSAAQQAAANDAMAAFGAYVGDQIRAREEAPRDDLLTSLIHAQTDDRLSQAELIAMVVELLFAGHETSRSMIGSLLYRLLEHPEQLARLRADRSLCTGAVEESLRFDAPITFTARVALHNTEVGGVPVQAGELVWVFLAAANFDPEEWDEPYRFDIGRTGSRPLSFGHGIHHCLGAPLARLEGAVAIDVLLKRFASIALTGDPSDWTTFTALRGRQRLDLQLIPT